MDRLSGPDLPAEEGVPCHNQDMVVWIETGDIGARLRRLAAALDSIPEAREEWPFSTDVGRLARSVRDYLLPRVENTSRPLTVVIAGPTGAGKSTLLNSIAGADVSSTGALRPTTRAPVALVAEEHADDHREIGGVECQLVTGGAPILKSMTLVDTPDVDSTETNHRIVAETLVDHADIVVFVTSALRYADAVPWQVLRRARARGTDVITVLNRISPATAGAMVDFRTRLTAAGLGDHLLTIPEHHLAPEADRLPGLAVRSLRKRLVGIASSREAHAAATLQRVTAATAAQVGALVDEIEQLIERRDEFHDELSFDLSSELEAIALHGVTAGFHEELPEAGSGLRISRWLRRNRRRPEEIPPLETRLADRLTSLVRGEMRRLVEGYQPTPRREAMTDVVDSQLATAVPSPVSEWLSFVRRIGEPQPGRQWSAEAALVDSACSGRVTAEADVLFGADAGALVERARRELVGRLQVIGAGVAAGITDLAYPGLGEVDLEGLRSAHAALVSRLALVHA